jgi:NTP pyrophosphatase (non-canonical NTP hydrolase)
MNMDYNNHGGQAGEAITLDGYQLYAQGTDQSSKRRLEDLPFLLLGLFGEAGTLLSALKKKRRDQESFVGYTEAIIEEFGDVLWYFSNVATRLSLSLSELARKAFRNPRDSGGGEDVATFVDVQAAKKADGSPESLEFEASLIALAGKVGILLNDFHEGRVANDREVLSGHLVGIFRALVEAANIADIDLTKAALHNIRKIHSRWPEERIYTPLFDEGFDSLEQLPRKITVHLFEKERAGKTYVFQQYNGVNIGSALTDNRGEQDDYRFHDVFHLAYAAILGWSPVIRALFNVKRKSDPIVDEAQDGARAIIIEEGISTLIFNRARRLNYFASVKSLDYTLLKMIPELVNGYEVERCPLWQWEKAILDGFDVFRLLSHHRRGVVTADLINRSILFEQLP